MIDQETAAAPMTSGLAGRVALVTGTGDGLGRQIALRLGALGCRVACHYASDAAGAARTAAMIGAAGGQARVFACDLGAESARAHLGDEVERVFGPIEVLVNNAARTAFIPFDDLAAAGDRVWRDLLELNLLAPVALVRTVFPGMQRRNFGRVLNIASTSALEPEGSCLPYAVSKAALVAYTQGLAAVAPSGVTVNALAPGWMDTAWAPRQGGERPGRAEARVEDVADIGVALLTNDAISGEVVVVDSGARWRRRRG